MPCLEHATLLSLEAGELSEDQRQQLEAHVTTCQSCEQLVADLLSLGDDVSAAPLTSGANFGRYLVIDKLGTGGMGTVYSAYDSTMDRRVALKLLRPEIAAGEEGYPRLLREAQALAQLSHPHVVQAYETGVCDGQPYLAMELVSGQTLAQWLREGQRSWRQVLECLLPAAQALSAAHSAGLVHRDFTPANVLVGADGRVRVTDFGLARPWSAVDATSPSQSNSPLRSFRTRETGVAGTPAYMAPEVLRGEPFSPAADQYSFAVVLYEGLYGVRPGPKRLPRNIPAWLHQRLLRALSTRPEERYPSVAALLESLTVGRTRAKYLQSAKWAALLAALVGAAGWAWPKPCDAITTRYTLSWKSTDAQQLTQAFSATGKPFAAQTALEVTKALDSWAQQWTQSALEACAATRVRHEQSESALDLRLLCLDEGRTHYEAVTKAFAAPDGQTVARALEIVHSLPSLGRCRSASVLARRRPSSPETRAQAESASHQVAQAQVLMGQGRVRDAIALASVAAQSAQASGELWTGAEAALSKAEFLLRDREARGEGEQASRQAFLSAEASGHDEVKGRAAALLAFFVGRDVKRRTEALFWLDEGRALLAAREADPSLEGRLQQSLTTLEEAGGHYREAYEAAQKAVASLEAALGADAPLVAQSLMQLGEAAQELGHYDEAQARFEDALARQERSLGPAHPEVARTRNDLGMLLVAMGHPDEAVPMHQEALKLFEASLGPNHLDVGVALGVLAAALERSGRVAEAEATYRKSILTVEALFGVNDRMLGPSLNNLAGLVENAGRPEEAIALYRRALAIKETLGLEHPTLSSTLEGLGSALLATGQIGPALESLHRSLAIDEKARGPDSPLLAWPLSGLGRAELARKRFSEAIAYSQRALALIDKQDIEPELRPTLLFIHARGLKGLHEASPQALDEARLALAQAEQCGSVCSSLHSDIAAWLRRFARD